MLGASIHNLVAREAMGLESLGQSHVVTLILFFAAISPAKKFGECLGFAGGKAVGVIF